MMVPSQYLLVHSSHHQSWADSHLSLMTDIYELLEADVYTEVYNTHQSRTDRQTGEPTLRTKLLNGWVKRHFKRQPMDDIRQYFGEKVCVVCLEGGDVWY